MTKSEINIKAEAAEIIEKQGNSFNTAHNNALFNPTVDPKTEVNEGNDNSTSTHGYDMLSDSLW